MSQPLDSSPKPPKRPLPAVIDSDMRPAEVVAALSDLHFRPDGRAVVWLDRDVRDFLIDAVSARRGKA